MDEATRLAHRTLHEINGLKYMYRSTLEGAISSAAHHAGTYLTPELKAATYEIVVRALPDMGFTIPPRP
jgi:hypothetical protein